LQEDWEKFRKYLFKHQEMASR